MKMYVAIEVTKVIEILKSLKKFSAMPLQYPVRLHKPLKLPGIRTIAEY